MSDASPYCLLTFHSNSVASRVRHHYGVKGRVIRLDQDPVSGLSEGHEVKDGLDDLGDVIVFVVSDAFA